MQVNNIKCHSKTLLYITLFFCVTSVSGFLPTAGAQSCIAPMDIPLYLSGGFGELRNNHFHSGIDFKTQGKTGIPVKSVKGGYVSRIFVSPWGYGRALYIDHPDGTTTVYGHLERFNDAIESFTLDSQYIKQSFKVDLYLSAKQFPVKQGTVIAYSGNTGGSSAPHLHFELRKTSTQEVQDPLMLYKKMVQDVRPPQIQSIMVYPKEGQGVIGGKSAKQIISLKKNQKGKVVPSPTLQVWGKIGFAIKAYDYMSGTKNIYGVKDITLKVDGNMIFRSLIDHFSFEETRYLNSFIDWKEWVYRKSFYMKSFIEPGNKLNIYRSKGDGFFDFNEERDYLLSYLLKDSHGNTSVFDFTVQGKKQTIPTVHPSGTFFPCDQDNVYEKDGLTLTVPRGNLYTDVYFSYDKTVYHAAYSPLYNSPLYKINENIPLHTPCPLSIAVIDDRLAQKEKYGLISVQRGKEQWIGGDYREGKIYATVKELSSFTVAIDTTPPLIRALKPESWSNNKKISFRVIDSSSGIASWTASLNDEFALFELDGKNNHLYCTFDARRMKPGKNILQLIVRDACGNETTFNDTIYW
ncbi:MAG: M23 family metallopeptidase [Dysgonamonadaceae bacterium]|nr:M23 family metallopeptidase [Dysgonamonadaceae bacterium]